MANDKLNTTRHGTATGSANERTMATSTFEGCQTHLRNNPDGTTTMLRTRGGFFEYTTDEAAVAAVTVAKCDWTYDFYPLTAGLTPDTVMVGGVVAPRMGFDSGAKTRRKGLVKNGDGTASFKLMESQYDWNGYDKPLSGPGFWYTKKHHVTWTVFSMVPYSNAVNGGVLSWVKCGKTKIQVRAADIRYASSLRIVAACRVKDSAGTVYIRVASAAVGGAIQNRIYIQDYLAATGALVSTVSFNTANAASVTVDGYSFSAISPERCAWSPNGLRFIAATLSPAYPGGEGIKALLLDVDRPAGGTPTVTASTYTPPVAVATAPARVRTDNTVEHSNSGGTVVSGDLTGPRLLYIKNAAGVITQTFADPGASCTLTNYYDRTRTILEISYAEYYSLARVGFAKDNTPACVVKTDSRTTTSTDVRRTHLNETSWYGTPEEGEFPDGSPPTGWSGVRWPTEMTYSLTGSGFEGDASGSTSQKKVITLHWCVGSTIVYADVSTLDAVASWVGSTIIQRQRTGTQGYDGVSHTVSWNPYTQNTITRTTSGISSLPRTLMDVTPLVADFYDTTLITHTYGPIIYGVKVEDSGRVEDYDTGAVISSWDNTPPPIPEPTTFEQKLKILRGRGAAVLTEHTFTHSKLSGYEGEAAWCPHGRSFLTLDNNRGVGNVWGKLYSGGTWRTVRPADGEPNHAAMLTPYFYWNINPFA